jgi:bifunctional DNase/RNase
MEQTRSDQILPGREPPIRARKRRAAAVYKFAIDWALGSALGCQGELRPAAAADEVAVGVRQLWIDPRVGSPVVLLSEEDGDRQVAIWIGLAEAHSIATQIDHRRPLRPNTHDLTKELVEELHGRVERVVVTELRENIYYAVVEVRSGGRLLSFDARPSDAIALALRFEAPVFVRVGLLAKPGQALEPLPEERRT